MKGLGNYQAGGTALKAATINAGLQQQAGVFPHIESNMRMLGFEYGMGDKRAGN